MTLVGKGYYLWQLPNCNGGDPKIISAKAQSAGLSHAIIKIADGVRKYNVDLVSEVDFIPPVMQELRKGGIEVWGWHYVRGFNPVAEARVAIDRIRELGVDGYVIDAEAEYKRPGRARAAEQFMDTLRTALPDLPIALSTYRFPRMHQQIPYKEFLEGCDYSMPQVYFEYAHNPESQLEKCVQQYMQLKPARPIIPTLPAYGRGSWRPSPDELIAFLAKAQELGLSAANAWSWDIASRSEYSDLWDAIADYDWPATPPVADMPERLIGRLNQHDPQFVAGLYRDNAAHVTGMRTVLGKQEVEDWYRDMFQKLPDAHFEVTGKTVHRSTRHFTWKAESSAGVIRDGMDTVGIRDGRIHFHYTYFHIS